MYHIIKIGEPHIKRKKYVVKEGPNHIKVEQKMTAHKGKKFQNNSNPDKVLLGILRKASQYGKRTSRRKY